MRKVLIILLFCCLVMVSTRFSASEKRNENFKVIIDAENEIALDNVTIEINILSKQRSKDDKIQYNSSSNSYCYSFSGYFFEFKKPYECFILTIDEKTLPEDYELSENSVFIDEDINVYKFYLLNKKESENKDVILDVKTAKEFEFSNLNNRSFPYTPPYQTIGYVQYGRFTIYYDTSENNGIDYASDTLDAILDIESFYYSYGYPIPFSNSNNDYYVYLVPNLEYNNTSVYGITEPGSSGQSVICINTNLFEIYNDEYAFVDTLAHEYYHACIYTYVSSYNTEHICINEGCATAAAMYYVSENSIYSTNTKEKYALRFADYYNGSYNSIENYSNKYSNFAFYYYLIQEIGFDFLADIFYYQSPSQLTFSALNTILVNMYTSLEEEYESFASYMLNPEQYFSVSYYYKDCFLFNGLKIQPIYHEITPTINNNSVQLSKLSSKYYSLKAYEGNDGCSQYEGHIQFLLPDYHNIKIYELTINSNGTTSSREVSIPTEKSNILDAYVVVVYTSNLGSSNCNEIRYVIVETSKDLVSTFDFDYRIRIRHRITNIYESSTITFGNIPSDLLYLKFSPYDTALYNFDISISNGSTISNEVLVKNSNLMTINRCEFGNIELSASNRQYSKSFVCYLEVGEIYYIKIRNETSIMNHSLNINRVFSTITPTGTPFGLSNQLFMKGDKLWTFIVPQDGYYSFNFSINFYIITDIYFIIYKETNGLFNIGGYDTLSYNNISSTITLQLSQGQQIYCGFLDYRGDETKTFNLLVTKII